MRIVVVGAGVTGLSAARELRTRLPAAEVLVLEASARAGGLVHTERVDQGLLIEHGADSLFAFKPQAMELLRELDMTEELVTGSGGARTAYVVQHSRLVPLPPGMLGLTPQSAWSLLCSSLLSTGDKLRLLCEPFVAARSEDTDESLRAFATRRFGAAFLEKILEPLVAGIHGAPTELLSAEAVMPNLVALEREHGSIAGAVVHARRKRAGGPAVVSLRHGMGSLPSRLAHDLRANLTCGMPVRSIARGPGSGLRLDLGSHGALRADAVVLAVDAWNAARLCASVNPRLSGELAGISHTGYASLHLAVRAQDIEGLPAGTGFVVPSREGRRLKACTWVSQKWPDRSPSELVLLRCFLREPYGSARELVEVARADLRALLGIEAAPVFEHVLVRERALPCYTLGHLERIARIEAALGDEPGLAVAGNYLRGIGLSDCIAAGRRASQAVVALA